MSSGGKFELDVASKGKRMCVTTNKGNSYEGIVEKVVDCALHGTMLLLRNDGTRLQLFGIEEIEYEVVPNENVEVEYLEDPVENIGAKLVPALATQ